MRHIDSVIAMNKAAGGTFFSERTVCYFNNKVLPTLYENKYFISYDVLENECKRFTVREVLPSGLIKIVGMRHAYATKAEARSAIRTLMNSTVAA